MIFRFAFEKLFKAREAANRARQAAAKPGADEGFDPYEKPFLDHLEDLRKTLGKMLVLILITTVFAFIFNLQIFEFIQLPAKMAVFEDGTSLFDKINLFTLKPQEILMLSIKTSFFAALIVSFPFLVWFAGEFIMPGLKQTEKRYVVPGVGVGFVLFLLGACFAFFLASPIALKFFYTFSLERFGMMTPAANERVMEYMPVQVLGEIVQEVVPDPETETETETKAETPEVETEAKPETETESETAEAAGPATAVETGEAPAPEADAAPAETSDAAAPPSGHVDEAAADASALDGETKAAVRDYLRELLVVEKGSEVSLLYDRDNDKLVIANRPAKTVSYTISEYINFITRLTLVFGISFQLPVVVVILVKLELLTARVMRNTRSYAWVVIMVAAAIFTPPDVFTLGLLAGPLILLYEICIWIAWGMERKRTRAREEEEKERQERLAQLYSKSHDELSEEEKAELHQHEIEQYEKEHAHLYQEESSHIPHDPHADPHHGHDGPYHHTDPHHDQYGHPYDPDHDEGWHDEYDPGHDPFHHDYHANDPDHEPVQDWPDHEGEHGHGVAESDHVAGKDTEDSSSVEEPSSESESESKKRDVEDDGGNDDTFHDDEVCEPDGPVVNLNSATEEEILTLPGIGPALAKTLIEHRPYENFDDVSSVPGIGDTKLYAMIDRLSIDQPEKDFDDEAPESGDDSAPDDSKL